MNKWKEKYLCEKRSRTSSIDGERKDLSAQTDVRSGFESDFGRVIFSPACRRLHDKTQVFPLTTNDNIHSRLTHSLEVMNMGLSFSIALSENKKFINSSGLRDNEVLRNIGAILKTSCLVHDIGNPPFGHFGECVFQNYFSQLFNNLTYIKDGIKETNYLTKKEQSLGEYERNELNDKRRSCIEKQLNSFLGNEDWKRDYTEFDGNAEGLRVLTKLQNAGDMFGLNLTYATLASTIKYPNTGKAEKAHKRIGNHKHGVFRTERSILNEIVKECGLNDNGVIFRHPLTFLMEAADSICYLVMDIDDAITKKWVSFEDVNNLVYSCDKETKEKVVESYKRYLSNNKSQRRRWMSLRTALLNYSSSASF